MVLAAALLAAMPDPAVEIEYRRQLCREVARDAYRLGHKAGVEHGARIRQADFAETVGPLLRPRPTHDEAELLRYGPGGREHYGDRRPGDFVPSMRLETAS